MGTKKEFVFKGPNNRVSTFAFTIEGANKILDSVVQNPNDFYLIAIIG
jgi:hypothetical protein